MRKFIKMASGGDPILALKGQRTTGDSVRSQNGKFFSEMHLKLNKFFIVLAASAIANVVKSSLGPEGLDKMLVDDVGVYTFVIKVNFHYEGIHYDKLLKTMTIGLCF